ncbi:MAG TPA: hypothetical protein VFA91_13235 [Candidatus Polarisedimenticolia bacterium]|nr:hypothetical protein [Candidatus Polarisedimenticolia bacterium]
MRLGQVSAAIGLSATVFAGSLVCAPLNAAASDFSNYLAQGYSQLAKAAGKAPVSQLYKKRSTAAAGGQAVEPLGPDASHLDVLTANEARSYRDQLIEGLQAGGRDRQPLLAAIAQVNYDCWVMPLPKRKGAPRSAECHQRFLQAFEGLPDKHHRGPISSVEPWQLAAVTSAPAPRSGDSIGALIQSLSPPSPSQRSAAFDAALASVYAVGGQPLDGQMMGNCDANCLAMSFSGPGTAPLIAALIENRDRNFRGPGNAAAGEQSANAGTTNGAPGTGNNGSANNGQTSNGQGTGTSGGSASGEGSGSGSTGSGSASGGPASGGPGTGPAGDSGSGDSGDGGDSSDGGDGGPGNGGGHGHGHGHGHNGGG